MRPHFSLLGVPVRIDTSFLFLVLLFGMFFFRGGNPEHTMTLLIAWAPLVTAAILAHELGHALTGRLFGLSPFIVLHGMGGLTQFPAADHRALSHGKRFLITAAGPAAGIAVGALVFAISIAHAPKDQSLAATLYSTAVYTTLGWGVLNLIPVLPLDGGHLLATVLERFFGLGGLRFTQIFSVVVAVLLAALSLWVSAWFSALLLASLAFQNWRAYRVDRTRRDDQPLLDALRQAHQALASGDPRSARALAEPMKGREGSTAAKVQLVHILAWSHLLEGDGEKARRELVTLPAGQRPDAYLEGRIALALGEPSRALLPLIEALVDRGDDEIGDAIAQAVIGSNRADELLALLESEERSAKVGPTAIQRVAYLVFQAERFDLAAAISQKLFGRFELGLDAFNAACALVRDGREPEAMRWLAKAADAGVPDPTIFDRDDDIAPLRAHPDFASLRARVS